MCTKLTNKISLNHDCQLIAFMGQLKMMINHFIFMSSILSINYEWISLIKAFLGYMHEICMFFSEFIRFRCIIKVFMQKRKLDITTFEEFHRNTVLTVLFPLFIIFIMVFLNCLFECKLTFIHKTRFICISIITFWFL